MTVSSSTRPSQKSRKAKAILAGGLVLGVGAAVTLASWTDQEWTEGLFGAGSFNIEGSVDGTTFTDHESAAGAASLVFDLPPSTNMSPTDVVAAPFAMRVDADTTYDASVVLESATAEGTNVANLTYGIIQVTDAAACTPEATGDVIVPAGTALNSVTGATGFDLTAGADAAAGTTTTLCFQIAAGANLEQGTDTTAQWQFVGTSAE